MEGEEVSVFGGWGGWRDVEEMGKAASGNMRKGDQRFRGGRDGVVTF